VEIVEIEAIILILTTFQSLLPPQFFTSKLNGIIWLAIVLNEAGMPRIPRLAGTLRKTNFVPKH
jgi:hypothetical protein